MSINNNVSSEYDATVVYSGTAPSYVTGLGGDQAISLTGGSGQSISLPNNVSSANGPPGPLDVYVGSPFTFECYFQLTSLPSSGTAVLAQRNLTWLVGVTSAGDVTATVSGLSAPLAAGVTLSVGTWYHVALVYTGFANTWYLLVNGAAPATPPTSGYDGGAVGPANQSLGGDGTANGTFPGLITAVRISKTARYQAAAYPPPAAPLPTDLATRALYSMNGGVKNTGVLVLTGPGGGPQAGSPSYGFTVSLLPGASLTDEGVTVSLLAGGTTTGLSPSSVTLSSGQTIAPFSFTPQSGQVGTNVSIAATATGLSPCAANFYIYTAQAYTIAVAAPYGATSTGLAAQLGYSIYDPANPANALRWAPGTASVTEQGPGTGIYMALVMAEPGWSRVLVWDAPYGASPSLTVLNPQRAAGS